VALTVGELNGYLRLDDSDFRRGINQSALRIVALAQIVEANAAEIDAAFAAITPTIQLDIDSAHVLAALDEVERRAEQVGTLDPTVHTHADVALTLAQLDRVDRASRRLGSDGSAGQAASRWSRLGSAIGGLVGPIGSVVGQASLIAGALGAAIPVAGGLVAAVADIVPAAAVAATAVFAIGQAFGAVKLGLGGIGSAFKAAFAPPSGGGGGGGGASSARQAADALRALRDAREQAAYANQQAAETEARAERSVADAQRQAKQAQQDLNDARQQAVRDLRDLNDQLVDSRLDERQASLDVTSALEALNQARAQGLGPGDQLDALQLAYDEAVQKLKEAKEHTDDLSTDTDKANKAGVEGSKNVAAAKQSVADANQNVRDQEQALADARQQQARTAAQGLESIQKAEEALAAAGASAGGGGGGVDKLAQALAKLSPNARAFVLQVLALHGAWTALQQDVQNRLFEGLAASLKQTATVVLPVLRTGLVSTAGALNSMALQAAGAARSIAKDGTLGQAMAAASTSLKNLSGLPAVFIRGITQIAVAAGPAFDALTASAGRGAASIGQKISEAFKDGRLRAAIDQAIALIKQIGVIGVNVGHILGSLFGAANQSGAGFLNTLQTITGALAMAFADPAVQDGLRSLFQTISLLARTAGPLLIQALQTIAPVLTALAPPIQQVITMLGGTLSRVITDLGPVLLVAADAVGQLLVAMEPLLDVVPILLPPLGDLIAALGQALVPVALALKPVLIAAAGAIGQIVEAVLPLLPVVGQMIAQLGPVLTPILRLVGNLFASLAGPLGNLGRSLLPPLAVVTGTLAKAFGQLAPVLRTAIQQLGTRGLMPIIVGLTQVIGQMVTQYAAQWLSMFEQLLPVIPLLVPVLVQLGQSIGQILVALAPLLPQITLLSVQLISNLLPAILALLPALTRAEILFLRLATGAITRVVLPALTLLTRAAQGLQHGLEPMVTAVTWVTTTIAKAFSWLYDVLLGHSIIPDIVNGAVRWFASLPGRAWSALSGLAGDIAGRARDAGNHLVAAIRTGLSNAVSWLGGLSSRARGALGDLSGVLWSSGQSLLRGFIGGIKSMGGLVDNAVSSVLSSARDFFPNSPARKGPFSGRGWTPYSGAALALGFASGMTAQAGAVGTAARVLAGAASAELAAPGTSMGALVASPRRGAGGAGAAGGGTLSGRMTVVIDARGGGDALMTALRKIISIEGGDVQLALGQG
jgi:phage-related protein